MIKRLAKWVLRNEFEKKDELIVAALSREDELREESNKLLDRVRALEQNCADARQRWAMGLESYYDRRFAQDTEPMGPWSKHDALKWRAVMQSDIGKTIRLRARQQSRRQDQAAIHLNNDPKRAATLNAFARGWYSATHWLLVTLATETAPAEPGESLPGTETLSAGVQPQSDANHDARNGQGVDRLRERLTP